MPFSSYRFSRTLGRAAALWAGLHGLFRQTFLSLRSRLCDMPFANALVFKAASDILVREEADVVIAKTNEGYEPLHAVYRRGRLAFLAIEAAIASV